MYTTGQEVTKYYVPNYKPSAPGADFEQSFVDKIIRTFQEILEETVLKNRIF